MTDPKKPRTPRELPAGEAINRLVDIGTREDFVERYVADAKLKAEAKARRDANAAYNDAQAAVLRRVHIDVQGIVSSKAAEWLTLNTPGAVEKADEPAPTTTEAADLPRGAQPMDPDRAARVERMAGRGAR